MYRFVNLINFILVIKSKQNHHLILISLVEVQRVIPCSVGLVRLVRFSPRVWMKNCESVSDSHSSHTLPSATRSTSNDSEGKLSNHEPQVGGRGGGRCHFLISTQVKFWSFLRSWLMICLNDTRGRKLPVSLDYRSGYFRDITLDEHHSKISSQPQYKNSLWRDGDWCHDSTQKIHGCPVQTLPTSTTKSETHLPCVPPRLSEVFFLRSLPVLI